MFFRIVFFEQDLRKQKLLARLSRRCWQKVLNLERLLEGESAHKLSRSNNLSSYAFRWLKATMTEEEVFQKLSALESGQMDVKTLNKLNKVKQNI